MSCVQSVLFLVLINGQPSPKYSHTYGLREGDPLSPFLFILCDEGLSTMFRQVELGNHIHGLPFGSRSLQVVHLMFSNDYLIFSRANTSKATYIKSILQRYEGLSGQRVNFTKSTLMLSRNFQWPERERIKHILGVKEGSLEGMYLGMPIHFGRRIALLFQFILERIWKRLSGWKDKILIAKGKETLIKAVIQAIPLYIM